MKTLTALIREPPRVQAIVKPAARLTATLRTAEKVATPPQDYSHLPDFVAHWLVTGD